MLTSLALSTVLFASGAPAPAPINAPPATREAAPAATGTLPPRIVEIVAEKDGKVTINVMRQQQINAPAAAPGGNPGGGGFRGGIITRSVKVELGDVMDLKITTAGGKEVSKEDAIKALAKGGQVVLSADGKSVAPAFLKLFKDEVLVMVSPEFVGGLNGVMIQGGGGAILPIGAPRLVPAQPAPQPQKID